MPQAANQAAARAQNAAAGLLALVGQDLGVGQPGVVIDGVVHEPIASSSATVAFAVGATEDLVPAAVGDVAQPFDVDVDHLAGCGALIAAHHAAGGAVQVRQPGQSVADQYSVDLLVGDVGLCVHES